MAHAYEVMWWLLLWLCFCHAPPRPERFTLTCSPSQLSVWAGSSVTLSCWFDPVRTDSLEIRWYQPNKYDTPVLFYEGNQIQEQISDPQYRSRVSLRGDLERGNVSLRLENLSLGDSGEFVCFVAWKTWYEEASVNVTVRAMGSSPVLSGTEVNGGQVNITCASDGWFPQPSVNWTKDRGTQIFNHSAIFQTDVQGLVSVVSWLLWPSTDSGWLSCSVGLSAQERRLNSISPSQVISGIGYQVLLTIMVVLLAMGIATVLLCLLGLMKPLDDKKEVEKTLREIPDWNQIQKFKESPTMDENSIQGEFRVFKQGKKVWCETEDSVKKLDFLCYVLCKDIFTSGQHYFEVEVADKLSWFVGVCSNTVKEKGHFGTTPEDGCFLLCYDQIDGIYTKSVQSESLLERGRMSVENVGVYLNCEDHYLYFYDADSHSYLCTIDNLPNVPLVPVLNPGFREKHAMQILGN